MRAAGLNAVEFYIPWNFHEDVQGTIDFEGWRNISEFLSIVNSANMVAIARPGPYICAEWENGGFPWWLLKLPGIQLRRSNQPYLDAVEKWWDRLLPEVIKPMLYANGGPIVMVQIENEYGYSPACDHKYMEFLRDLAIKHLGDNVVYSTVDGHKENMLACGSISGTYTTVDFGAGQTESKVQEIFAKQRDYNPKGGPPVNSEFWPGWFDTWKKQKHQTRSNEAVINTMKYMWDAGASFNFYMFHGGTNFGYWNGAAKKMPYSAMVTSYDYDAPLSEAGDITSKYLAVRDTIKTLTGKQPGPIPDNTTKMGYGTVKLKNLGPILHQLDILSPKAKRAESTYPETFEKTNTPYGFMLYETELNNQYVKNLSLDAIHDRAYVMQDGLPQGIIERDGNTFVKLNKSRKAQKIQILVENQGRQNSGHLDPKGIIGNVFIDGTVKFMWKMFPIDFAGVFSSEEQDRQQADSADSNHPFFAPTVFYGTFPAAEIADTFFDPSGWGKGQLFINGHNIGRYWPSAGPQVTLFVPKYFLQPVNRVVLFELEKPGLCSSSFSCNVSFKSVPKLQYNDK